MGTRLRRKKATRRPTRRAGSGPSDMWISARIPVCQTGIQAPPFVGPSHDLNGNLAALDPGAIANARPTSGTLPSLTTPTSTPGVT